MKMTIYPLSARATLQRLTAGTDMRSWLARCDGELIGADQRYAIRAKNCFNEENFK
jgi:hypothetical protein